MVYGGTAWVSMKDGLTRYRLETISVPPLPHFKELDSGQGSRLTLE